MDSVLIDSVILAAGALVFWAGHCSGIQKGYQIRFMETNKP